MRDKDVLRSIGLCTVLAFAGVPLQSSAQSAIAHYRLDIPREPLDVALKAFALQTGLQIARFSDEGSAEIQVGPVSGSLTSEQALKMLLADSGLTYHQLNHETIAVVNQQDVPDANRIGRRLDASTDQQSPTSPTQPEEIVIKGTRRTKIVFQDKTLNQEIQRLLAQGYRSVSRNGEMYYCRSEDVLGTRFPKTICRTLDQIKELTEYSRQWAEAAQRPPEGRYD
jgi:hypothetical protein